MESADRSQGRVERRTFLKGVAAGTVSLGLAGAWARPALSDEGAGATARAAVKTRTFGRTNVPISTVMYGSGALKPENVRMLQIAHERGLFGIDTAQSYQNGKSEEAVGVFLRSGVDREKVFLTTKASAFRRPPNGTAKDVLAAVRANVELSLKRMNTDYLDLFLWPHGANTTAFLEDEAVRDALKVMREEKKLRFLGFSSHANYEETVTAGIKDGFYDVVLTVINICTQNAEVAGRDGANASRGAGRPILDTRGLLALAKEKNVGIMAMKVAKDGFLSQPTDGLLAKALPADSPLSRHQKLYTYGLRQPGVSTVVIGMGNAKHLKEAVEVASA